MKLHAVSLLEQISNVLNIDSQRFQPPQFSPPQAPLLPGFRGGVPSGTKPAPPAGTAPAAPATPGMFDQIMSGAGMTPAMGGLVAQTLGPDMYNPWVADGAEPDEFQVSGPEKCTRLMNNWLWKCAMSPM